MKTTEQLTAYTGQRVSINGSDPIEAIVHSSNGESGYVTVDGNTVAVTLVGDCLWKCKQVEVSEPWQNT